MSGLLAPLHHGIIPKIGGLFAHFSFCLGFRVRFCLGFRFGFNSRLRGLPLLVLLAQPRQFFPLGLDSRLFGFVFNPRVKQRIERDQGFALGGFGFKKKLG